MNWRTYRCPYCFDTFKADRDEGNDVDMAPDCGHHFTLGEARRGRPDPANQDQVEALTARVAALESQLAAMQAKLDAAVVHFPCGHLSFPICRWQPLTRFCGYVRLRLYKLVRETWSTPMPRVAQGRKATNAGISLLPSYLIATKFLAKRKKKKYASELIQELLDEAMKREEGKHWEADIEAIAAREGIFVGVPQ